MFKKINLVMLAFTAMLLTQCKDDNSSPFVDLFEAKGWEKKF